jgi:uncharacterized protein
MPAIRANSVLPARREAVHLHTADGLTLVGELALPADRDPVATLVCLHPLPTHGGMMDSHVIRKASYRLPALTGIAVLRFNTRGAVSDAGASEGEFDDGVAEAHDVAAAVAFVAERGLPAPWLLGWSFGSELVLRYGTRHREVAGGILLSPPLRRAGDAELAAWADDRRPLVVLVPELDTFLPPDRAEPRFARVPRCRFVAVAGAKHLWVGERHVRRVLDEVVAAVAPSRHPLPDHWPVKESA